MRMGSLETTKLSCRLRGVVFGWSAAFLRKGLRSFKISRRILCIEDLENKKVRVLFVSEGNVCRSVYAEAIFNSLIEEHGMHEFVECASKGSRDYNVDESLDPRAVLQWLRRWGLSCQKEL